MTVSNNKNIEHKSAFKRLIYLKYLKFKQVSDRLSLRYPSNSVK